MAESEEWQKYVVLSLSQNRHEADRTETERGVSAQEFYGEGYSELSPDRRRFQSVYAWFSGKALPSLDNMYALSYLLGRSIDELIVPQKKRILSEESSYSMEYATKDKVLLYECFPGYRARATG